MQIFKYFILENRYIVRDTVTGKKVWDIFIISLAIYNCFSIPFILAFRPQYSKNIANEVIENLIDITFFFDLIVNFCTTYID